MKVKLLPGFTLVELLVSISLIGILSGVGITSYTNFKRSQTVNQAASQIVQDLRLAQSLALNGQKPGGCDTLENYTFRRIGNTYVIFAKCRNNCGSACPSVKSGKVPSNLSLSGFTVVKFKVLHQGIETTGGSALNVTLNLIGFTKTKTITINTGGGTITL